MVYRWYKLPTGWLYITYHLLREPETAIDFLLREWGSGISVIFVSFKRLLADLAACPWKSFQSQSNGGSSWVNWSLQELIGKQVIRLLSPDLWTQYQLDCNSPCSWELDKTSLHLGDVQKEGQTLRNNLSQITSKQFFLKNHFVSRLCSLRLHFS